MEDKPVIDCKNGFLGNEGMRLDPGLRYCSALTCVGQWLLGCALSWVSTKAAVGSMIFPTSVPTIKLRKLETHVT